MSFLVVGLSHRTAPVDVRERVAIPEAELGDALAALAALDGVREGLVVSTCNRTEFYVEVADTARDGGRLLELLAERAKTSPGDLEPFLYIHADREAVRHVFRVASSLDSMVVGESQILGQVKAAFAVAQAAGSARGTLGRLLERAFAVAKRVRNETAIGESTTSVASVAVDLAGSIFGDLRGRSVLLVGAGKMGRLTLRHLRAAGVATVWVANRSVERARTLLGDDDLGAFFVPLERVLEPLERVDIALSSIQMGEFLLDRSQAEPLVRRRRGGPLFLVDIAVPRSLDPAIHDLENVFLYDIDDLKGVVEANMRMRHGEVPRAEKVVDAETDAFLAALRETDAGPLVRRFLERLESIRRAEIDRHLYGVAGLTPEIGEAVEQATRAIVAKIAHAPIQELKRTLASPGGVDPAESLRKALLPDEKKDGGTR